MNADPPPATIARLSGGLIMRRAAVADADELAAFNARVHGGPAAPAEEVGAWTRDLLTRPHPTFHQGGFLVVEDPAREPGRRIVSSLNLIPQTWSYGGVRFGVGQVEIVGTDPDYRRRGLVRHQMEEVHRWSAALGHPVQIITGISNFYRQFGYEQGLAMGGGRAGNRYATPVLAAGATEPYRLRPAIAADADFLARLEEAARPRFLLTVPRDAALWRYELEGKREDHLEGRHVDIVEAAAAGPQTDDRVGYLVRQRWLAPTLTVTFYELVPGLSWLAVTPSVMRALKAIGDAYVPETPAPGARRFERFHLELGQDHPALRASPERFPEPLRQHAQYVRVPDLAAFLRHVAPVLERRLAASVAVGYSGRLRLSFYRAGLLLTFEEGRLVAVDPCPHHTPAEEAGAVGAAFPDLTFLQLLFGSRSLEELEHAFGDVRTRSEEARVLLGVLFAKQPSAIWPLS
jgi:GNAT superfamily N-acetyltransferase